MPFLHSTGSARSQIIMYSSWFYLIKYSQVKVSYPVSSFCLVSPIFKQNVNEGWFFVLVNKEERMKSNSNWLVEEDWGGGAERGERLGNEVMKQLCAAHTESAEQAGYTLLEYPNGNDTVGLINRCGLETQLYYIIPGNDFLLLSFVISKMEVILPGQPASKGCSGWAKKQNVWVTHETLCKAGHLWRTRCWEETFVFHFLQLISLCTPLLVATIAKNWKQPKYQSEDEWIKRLW